MQSDRKLSGVGADVPYVGTSGETAVPDPSQASRRTVWTWVGTTISVAIVALSVYVLVRTLARVSMFDLRNAIRATSFEQILAACFFTAVSYCALTGYDAIALRHLKLKVPFRTTALGSFTSYAISFTIGFYIVTAGAVRYWIYSRNGLSAGKVAALTVIAGLTFYLGIAAMLGVGMLMQARALTAIDGLPPLLNGSIGFWILAMIIAYLAWAALGRRRVRIQGFYLKLPGATLTLGQILLGMIDACAGAAALYSLLPSGATLDYMTFVAAYSFASLLAMASHAPGGIGVLEASMLKVVAVPSSELLASLLLFRVIYYLVPFVLALAVLGATESLRRWRSLVEAMEEPAEE